MNERDTASTREPERVGWIAGEAVRPVLISLTALLLGLSVLLTWVGAPLQTEAAPQGIVSFELARTAEAAQAIVASWSPEAREAAMLVQGIDALYLLVYPAWLWLVCALIARSATRPSTRRIGRGLAAGIWLAAPLDALENVALVKILMAPEAPGSWPFIAWAAAVPKFGLVFAAMAFCIAAGVPLLLRRGLSR